jgi:hypothetical protein
VYEHGWSRGLNIPTSVVNRSEIRRDFRSPTQENNSLLPSYEVPNKPVATKPATPILPATTDHDWIWVTVLVPARLHTGPSVDTPISHFYPVGTTLQARRYHDDWFEIIEPRTAKSGWIYREYLGAISNSEQSKIASRESQGQSSIAQSAAAQRSAKAVPVKRYAKNAPSNVPPSKKSRRLPVMPKPIHGQTEMASLLQRAFSGY